MTERVVNENSGQIESPEKIDKSLDAMYLEATRIGLKKGVAFVSVQSPLEDKPTIHFTVVGRMERDPDPEKEGDIGTNYLAVAMAKMAYMMSTRTYSGSGIRPIRFGEVEYRGGLVWLNDNIATYIGFSGGTEEQDLQIAQKGLKSLLQH